LAFIETGYKYFAATKPAGGRNKLVAVARRELHPDLRRTTS